MWPSADILEPSPHPDILCFVEDPTFGYEDFTRRGTQAPPTFRAQVLLIVSDLHRSGSKLDTVSPQKPPKGNRDLKGPYCGLGGRHPGISGLVSPARHKQYMKFVVQAGYVMQR